MIALLRMSAGLIVWAIAFCVLYGLHGIGCAAGWPSIVLPGGIGLHRALLVLAWVGCLAAGAAVAFSLRPPPRSRHPTLIGQTGWRLAWVGLIATGATGLPVLLLPACL